MCYLFKVPITFDFVQVVDMFFKMHKVFFIKFNEKIKPMMTLIDHFIFKFPPASSNSITALIQNASIKLFQNSDD